MSKARVLCPTERTSILSLFFLNSTTNQERDSSFKGFLALNLGVCEANLDHFHMGTIKSPKILPPPPPQLKRIGTHEKKNKKIKKNTPNISKIIKKNHNHLTSQDNHKTMSIKFFALLNLLP